MAAAITASVKPNPWLRDCPIREGWSSAIVSLPAWQGSHKKFRTSSYLKLALLDYAHLRTEGTHLERDLDKRPVKVAIPVKAFNGNLQYTPAFFIEDAGVNSFNISDK